MADEKESDTVEVRTCRCLVPWCPHSDQSRTAMAAQEAVASTAAKVEALAAGSVDALAAAILPWVAMPNSTTSPENGRPWTDAEKAAYDEGRSFTEGGIAARGVRARAIAADALAALPALGWIGPDDEFGRDIVEANGHLGAALIEARAENVRLLAGGSTPWFRSSTVEWGNRVVAHPDAEIVGKIETSKDERAADFLVDAYRLNGWTMAKVRRVVTTWEREDDSRLIEEAAWKVVPANPITHSDEERVDG